jgi:GNAT superfamily N-acetyltransferase
MGSGDVASVAELHRRCFPDYESTRLGAGYCRRMLRAYSRRPEAWVSIAVDDSGRTLGYLVAAPRATQRDVDRRLLPWAAANALRRPAALAQGLRKVIPRLRRLVGQRGDAEGQPSPGATLSGVATGATIRVVLVAVEPAARGRGVVDVLLGAFADEARRRGHRIADLSVAPGNRAAHGAYVRNGWVSDGGDAPHFRLELSGPAAP